MTILHRVVGLLVAVVRLEVLFVPRLLIQSPTIFIVFILPYPLRVEAHSLLALVFVAILGSLSLVLSKVAALLLFVIWATALIHIFLKCHSALLITLTPLFHLKLLHILLMYSITATWCVVRWFAPPRA